MEPYVIVKKAALDIGIAFWLHKKRYHDTNVIKPIGFVEECRHYYSEMVKVNQRGKSEPVIAQP